MTYVSNAITRAGDPKAIAHDANSSEPTFAIKDLDGLTIISWPSSKENVPANDLPVEPRPVERYVILVPNARFDLVFDAVPADEVDAYLRTVASSIAA